MEEIIRRFLEKGMSLDKFSLQFFSEHPEKIQEFFEKIETMEKKPVFVTKKEIFEILTEKKLTWDFEEIKKEEKRKNKVSIGDVENFMVERYERFRNFFTRRLDIINPVSINRIGNSKKFSIIGMVRKIDEDAGVVILEDLTGEIEVHLDEKKIKSLVEDEVIAILCEKDHEVKGLKIFWPDVPIKKKIVKSSSKSACFFISNLYLWEKDVWKDLVKKIEEMKFEKKYIFLMERVFDHEKKIEEYLEEFGPNCFLVGVGEEYFGVKGIHASQPPSFFRVEGLKILVTDYGTISELVERWKGDGVSILLNLLKKRHLNPIFDLRKMFLEEKYFLKEVPDLFVASYIGKPGFMNYKGVTLIANGSMKEEPIFFGVDLSTREIIKVEIG